MQVLKTKRTTSSLLAHFVVVGVLGAGLFTINTPAEAQPDAPIASQSTAVSVERLVAEFGPWIGKADDIESISTTLLSGRATSTTGAASVPPATGPLGYGEARLALKLAQGALAQQGVTNPDADQLRVALHGGELRTAQGPQEVPGVLPQKVQGTGWGAMATGYGLSAQDMLPPPRPHVARAVAQPKPGKVANAKSKAAAAKKGVAKKVAAKPAAKKAATAATRKPVAKAPPKKAPPKPVK